MSSSTFLPHRHTCSVARCSVARRPNEEGHEKDDCTVTMYSEIRKSNVYGQSNCLDINCPIYCGTLLHGRHFMHDTRTMLHILPFMRHTKMQKAVGLGVVQGSSEHMSSLK